MEAGSYQTYRLDVTPASRLEKHPDYTDVNDATYARPTDYKSYYDIAYEAFKYVAENPGAAKFDANDYSTFFTQLHAPDGSVADESIFEDENVQGSSTTGNCERPMLSAVPLPVLTSSVYVSHTVRLVSTPPSTMACLIPKTYVATSLAPLQVLI